MAVTASTLGCTLLLLSCHSVPRQAEPAAAPAALVELKSSLRYRLREAGQVQFTVEEVATGGFDYSICLHDAERYACQKNAGQGSTWRSDVEQGWTVTVYRTVRIAHAADASGRVIGASETWVVKPPDGYDWAGDLMEWRQEDFFLRLRAERMLP